MKLRRPSLISPASLGALAFAVLGVATSHAATLYWKTSAASSWGGAFWGAAAGGPYTTAYTTGSDVVFEANGGTTLTITGATTNFASITANENVTVTASGTVGTNGTVATITVASGKNLDFGSQSFSTAAGTGFIKAGAGTLTLQGNTYTGGFTLNAGTVAVGGINAMGAGGVLTINGGTIRSNSTTARDLTGKYTNIVIGGDFTVGDATNNGALTFSNNMALGAVNRTITVSSATTFGGVISGSASVGLTKLGTGTLTLSGANTYTGTTTVSAGNLVATVNTTQNSLGTGAASIAGGATLQINNTNITGTAPVIANTFTGAGLLKLNFAANTTARNTTMNNVTGFAGTIQLSNAGANSDKWTVAGLTASSASVIVDSGSQLYVSSGTNTFAGINIQGTGNGETRGAIRLGGTLVGNITLANNATIGSENGTLSGNILSGAAGTQTLTFGTTNSTGDATVSGIIGGGTGAIALTKTAAGILTLSGANTFTGSVTVSDGALRLGSAGALGNSPFVIVENSTNPGAADTNSLQLSGGLTFGTGKTVYLRNNSTSNIANARVALDNNSGNNTWAGSVVLEGGLNQTLTSTAGTFTLSGNVSQGASPSTSLFIRGAGTGIFTGNLNIGTAPLFKTDAGTWTFSTSGHTHGALGIGNGTLVANATNAFNPSTTLTLGEGNGNNARFTVNSGFTQSFAGVTTASTSSGSHNIDGAGSLDAGAGGLAVTVFDGSAANDLTITANIIGAGGISKLQTGTLVLNNTTTGPVSVQGGTLVSSSTLGGLSLAGSTTLVPGTATTVGTINTSTLSFGTGTTSLLVNVGSNGSDAINVTTANGFTQAGTTTITVTPNGGVENTSTFYPLVSFSGTSPGTSGFTLGALPGRVTGSVGIQGSVLGLNLANDRVVWTGSSSGAWDVNTTANWKKSSDSSSTNFLAQDDVIFNNDGIAQNNVALTGTINPTRVEFAHTSGTYTLASGTLSGTAAMPLIVSGGGTVVLKNTNTYTGPTLVTAGTLELDHSTGTLTGTSVVDVSSGATLRLTRNNVDFTFNRNLSGSGTVVIDANTSGTSGSRTVTLSGTSTGFTGTLNISPSGTYAANGSFRVSAGQANLGSAAIMVSDRGQIWASNALSNNLTLTGAGFAEVAGGSVAVSATAADGSSPVVPNFAYAGIGAVRMGAFALSGNITISGDAKITPYTVTGTLSGSLTKTNASDTFVFGGTNSATASTLVLTGDASGLGRIWVNGGSTAAGAQTLIIGNNTTTGTLGSGDVILYQDAAAAVLRFQRTDGYTLASGQNIIAAHNGTATNLTKAAVQINTTGTGFTIGNNIIDLSDGTNGGFINVASNISGAIFNIGTGATIETGYFGLGENTGNSATVNQSGGAVAINGIASNSNNNLRIGHYNTETSTYTISSGTLSFNAGAPASTPAPVVAAELGGGIYVGIDGQGIFNQSGGTVTTNFVVLDNRGDSVAGTNMATGIDQYNLSGGTLALKSQYGIIGHNVTTEVNLSGGTIQNGGTSLNVAINAVVNTTAATTTTLDTVSAGNSFTLMNNVTGTGTITTTGGGTINLNPDSNTIRTGTSTGTGTQTISAVLDGSSAFTKLGSGTTTLSAANTYTGDTTVSAGRLNLTGSIASSNLTVANGASLGGEGTAASITFGSGGTTTLYVDGSTAGALTSTGTLTVNGTLNLDLTSAPISASTVVLNHGGTSATSGNFTLLNAANYRSPTINVGASTVTLDITQKALVWDGTTSTWELGGADNDWNDTANDNFFNGDDVTFDDTLVVANQSITVGTTVLPASVIVNNTTYTYSLTGAGGIGGATSVVKNGTASFTLGGANNFTGGITVNEGTLNLAAGATQALGASGNVVTVNAGGQVNFKGVSLDATRSYSFSIAGDGPDGTGAIRNDTAVINQNSRIINLTLTGNASIGAYGGTLPTGNRLDVGLGGAINGNGFTLTKLGDAMLDLRGPATDISYVVSAGTLRVEDSDLALGSTGVSVATGATLDSYGNRTLSVPVTFAAGSFLTSSNSTGTWTGPITLSGGNFNIGGAGTLLLATNLSETATTNLVKNDSSTTVLTGTNAFTGKTTVNTGILRISSDAALGVAPGSPLADSITLQSGGRIQGGNATTGVDVTLDSNRGVTLASGDGGFHVWTGFTLNYGGAITGAGNLTKTDGGVLNYSGSATHTGATTFSVGTTNLNGASISGTSSFTVSGGTTNLTGTTLNTAGGFNLTAGTTTINSGSVLTTAGSLRATTATLNVTGGDITAGRMILDDGSNSSSTVNQSGGTVTITGTDSSNTNTASFLFGHWGAGNTATYNLSGGTLNSTGAELSFGWDTTTSLFNQTGGTANLLGLDLGNSRNGTAIYSLNGGRLNLGANGVTTNVNKMLNLGGGTLGAFANWSTSQAMVLTGTGGNIKVNTLDSADNTTARTVTMSGILSGPGGLVKEGAGILNLGAINTYTGGTTINGGVLNLTTGGASGAIRGTVTVNSGGVLRAGAGDVTGYNTDATRVSTINLSGGEFNINTTTNQTLGSAVINMAGGSITGIATSNLDFFAGASALNSLASATTSTVSGVKLSIRQTAGLTVTTALGTTPSGVDLEISSVIASNGSFAAAPLIKAGAGTLVLTGTNTHTGGTTIGGGTLGFANGSLGTTGAITFSASSTLRWETGNTQDVSSRLAAIGSGITATLDTNGNDVALVSVLSGAGSLAKNGAGNLTLSGNNTYSGGTTLNGGTATAGSTTAFGSSTITLATGATLNLNSLSLTNPITNNGGTIIGANGSATITQNGGTLSGNVGGIITASGTVAGSPTITGTIQGTATFTGAVTIANGAFAKGTGNFSGGLVISSGGTLSPGNSPGTTSAGDTVWNGGGNYVWELNSVAVNPGTNQDFLSITGTLTLNATPSSKFNLKVTSLTALNAAGAVPDFASAHPGYTWTIVTASGGITGFDADAINIDLTNFVNPNVLADWQVQNIGNDISLVYVPEPSTYAALAGLSVLGLAWNRRRQRRRAAQALSH